MNKQIVKKITLAIYIASSLLCGDLVLAQDLPVKKWVTTQGTRFVDQKGNQVFLRGVNVSNSAKTPPFKLVDSLEDLDRLKELGFNHVRASFIWEAYEPIKGQYNPEYMAHFKSVVEHLAKNSISTIIDFHADAFSRYLIHGCGSGFPDWTLPPDVTRYEPDNSIERCKEWAPFAIQEMMVHGDFEKYLNAFYANTYGVRDAYIQMVQSVAREFSRSPWVIGYDLLNEPNGDEEKQILPLYIDLAKAVRAVDPSSMIIVEPFMSTATLPWMTRLPKPPIENLAYGGHNYDVGVLGWQQWHYTRLFHGNGLKFILERSKSWNVPAYIGEFGAYGTNPSMADFMQDQYALYDEYGVSAAQWVYNPKWDPIKWDDWNAENLHILDQNFKPRYNFEVRPFPRKISGQFVNFKVTPKSETNSRVWFEMTWLQNNSNEKTEIFIPAQKYFSRSSLRARIIKGKGIQCTLNAEESLLSCQADPLDPPRANSKVKIQMIYRKN